MWNLVCSEPRVQSIQAKVCVAKKDLQKCKKLGSPRWGSNLRKLGEFNQTVFIETYSKFDPSEWLAAFK